MVSEPRTKARTSQIQSRIANYTTVISGKVKSLGLTKYHIRKMYGGVEVQFHDFLTFGLDGDDWSSSCPSPACSLPAILTELFQFQYLVMFNMIITLKNSIPNRMGICLK